MVMVVVAVSVTGQVSSIFSKQVQVPGNTFTSDTLDPPTSLTAGPSGGSIVLNWTATVDTYASGHRVLRGTASGGPYSQIAQVTPRTTTSYTDSTASPGVTYYYVVRSYYQNWESANSNQASATVAASGTLNLQSDFTMSVATSPTGTFAVKKSETKYFPATSPVTSASNAADWTLVLVLKDKPVSAAAPATVSVWWQSGGTCSTGAVAGQIFATGSISVPVAVDKRGHSFTVPKTGGSVSRNFVSGDLLCMSINNSSGAEDVNIYANTASTSGATGVSRLQGSFVQDTLDPPTNVAASAGASESVINLSWTATPDLYADGYRVYRSSTQGGPYSLAGQVAGRTTTTYQDTGLVPGRYYYVVRSYFSATESVNSAEAAGSTIAVLYLHRDFTMSTAVVTADKIDVNHGQTKYFTASSGVASASNASDWTLVMVMRDKPTEASPATVNIWWRSGGSCSSGPVGGQVVASGTVSVPAVTADKVGVSVTVPKTGGVVDRTFVAGDLLCMSMSADGVAGANDVHFYGDTAATSGESGVSRLKGSFTQ